MRGFPVQRRYDKRESKERRAGLRARYRDVNRALSTRGHDNFGWSMRPWESGPRLAGGGEADSEGRMDPMATDSRLPVAEGLTERQLRRD
jgi:hypothetical protein